MQAFNLSRRELWVLLRSFAAAATFGPDRCGHPTTSHHWIVQVKTAIGTHDLHELLERLLEQVTHERIAPPTGVRVLLERPTQGSGIVLIAGQQRQACLRKILGVRLENPAAGIVWVFGIVRGFVQVEAERPIDRSVINARDVPFAPTSIKTHLESTQARIVAQRHAQGSLVFRKGFHERLDLPDKPRVVPIRPEVPRRKLPRKIASPPTRVGVQAITERVGAVGFREVHASRWALTHQALTDVIGHRGIAAPVWFVGDIADPTGKRHESQVHLAARILWGHPIQVMVQQRKIELRGVLPRAVFVKPTPRKSVVHVRRAALGNRARMVIDRKHGFVLRVV